MSVRSTVMWNIGSMSAANTDVFTVPSDRTALVKTCVVVVRSGSPTVSILFKRGAAETPLLRNRLMAADEQYVLPFDVVLLEADRLRISITGAGGVLASYGSGSLLLGDPE